MTRHRISQCLLILLLLTACSGGGFDIAEGGLEGTGLGEGAITDFGSIIVNDIRYDTSQTEIYLNNVAAGAEQLKRGMYVSVETAQDETLARRVTYRDTLRGPVEFITPSTLRVLAHTVRISPDTRLYGFADLGAPRAGDTVRVSGPATGPGILPATLVERVPAGDVRITGVVVNLNEAGHRFFIAGLQISYAEAQILPAQLYNGLPVEMTGGAKDPTKPLNARYIRALTPEALPPGSNAVVDGTVTRFDSTENFEVQYRPVRLPRALAADIADRLGIGVQVRIYGVTDTQGIIEVSKIILGDSDSAITGTPNDQIFRVSGPVAAVDTRTIEVSGVKARFNDQTLFRDMSGQTEDYRVENVRTGDYISVAGIPDAQHDLLAEMVNYEPFVQLVQRQLQGPATDIDTLNRRLHIFNLPVFTTTQTRYYDASEAEFNLPPPGAPLQPPPDTETDAEAFFARLSGEGLVYAFGHAVEAGMMAEMLVVLPFQ